LRYQPGSSKLLLYFHANAEDIIKAREFLSYIRDLLRINVLAIEYPGYSFYTEKYQNVKKKNKSQSQRSLFTRAKKEKT